jgi:hypothetical protein
LLSQRNF